jgi:PAS domain S-box-containing protein
MEAALRESEARLSGIISSAMDAIISVDAAERILLFNPAAERMFRCAATDAVGQSLDRFIPGFLAESGPAEGHGVVGGPMRLLGTWGLRASGDRFPLEASLSRTDLDGEKLWTIIVRDVTERARAELMVRQSRQALETSRGELRALTGLLLTAYEDERRRVSQELHDDVSQRLAAVAVELESLQRGPSRSARSLSAPLGKVHDQVAQLADDVHRLAYALHPRMLDDLGLALALETYLRDLAKRPGVSARMRQRALRSSIPRDHALCLYRVAQEALRNVTRHAGAARVTVTLAGVGGGIALCVKDTGNGFDPAAKGEPRRGLGLVSMEERVRLIDGRLVVRSRPGGGTHVHAWAPLPSGPEDVP